MKTYSSRTLTVNFTSPHQLEPCSRSSHYLYILGTAAQIEKIKKNQEKENAQVLDIRYTLKRNPLATPLSFITTHSHFTQPDIVLNKNVHLLSIEPDIARFLECDPDVDLYNSRDFPFLHFAQTANAKRLITIPRSDLDVIVSNINIDDREVVWLFHTTRCGSTLWGQIFNSLPNWTTISESQTLYHSINYRRTDISDLQTFAKTEEYEEMVVAWIKMQVSMIPKDQSIFWKSMTLDHHAVPIIQKRFPNQKIMFGYRDTLGSAKSYYKAFGSDPWINFSLKYFLNRKLTILPPVGRVRGMWFMFSNGYDLSFCSQTMQTAGTDPSVFEWFTMLWCCIVTMMRNFQANGVKFKSIKYEELQASPKKTIAGVFDYVGISASLVDTALAAMDRDSQAGAYFSKDNREVNRTWVSTEKSLNMCNHILMKFGFPNLDAEFQMDEQK